MNYSKHTPVLLKESIDSLNVIKDCKYIDATFGEGGHTKEILKRGGKVLGIDWNDTITKNEKLKTKILFVEGNFAEIERIANENGFYPCDGIIFDFGLSMNQIANSGRGFSYKAINDPLDMRINLKTKIKASDIINFSDKKELYEIFSTNSEEIHSRTIAEYIVSKARMNKIVSVGDLVKLVKGVRGTTEHTIKRIFQALRMEVNNELENIEKAFFGAIKIVNKGGHIVFITFHSVEDRLIKQMIKKSRCLQVKKIRSKNNYSFEKTAVLRVICV